MSAQQLFQTGMAAAKAWRGSEMYSVALEGVWLAALSYDSSKSPNFMAYAHLKARWAVLEAERVMADVPRRSFRRGARRDREPQQWLADSPNPEELLLQKERLAALYTAVAHTFGHEGALLRATLLEEEHQALARRRGLSKSWASRINDKAERRLGRQLREFQP